jgi:hypothetical protein
MNTTTITPHRDAPLWVWHAWLCHGADPTGHHGEICPDGCDGAADPARLTIMRAQEHAEFLLEDARDRAALEAELEEVELEEEPVAERERCGGYTNLATLTGGCGDCPDCDAGELEYDRQEERGRGPD